MIKLATGMLLALLTSTSAFSSVTFKQAQNVFNQLQAVSGIHSQLKYNSSTNSNAWTDGRIVTINRGMLRDVQNNGQLAMVLGHELGHIKGGSKELTADAIGYQYCQAAVYNNCLSFIYRMAALYGWDESDAEHPSWTVRLQHLQGTSK